MKATMGVRAGLSLAFHHLELMTTSLSELKKESECFGARLEVA